jgi:hypothetical protein
MPDRAKRALRRSVVAAVAALVPLTVLSGPAPAGALQETGDSVCRSQAEDIAGCQPGSFDVLPLRIPTRRIDATGEINPMASEADVRAGSRVLEERLGLFRNMQHVHWVPLTPSVQDPATGRWSGGDLDGEGDGRALTIAGKCLFAGHANSNNGERPMEIYRLADDPLRSPPAKVGEIPVPDPGADDSIMSARLYRKADGSETIVVARDISTDEGGLWVYEVNPANCSVIGAAEGFEYGGDMHEMGMWIDPKNPLRTLIVASAWNSAGRPDPHRPGKLNPDIRVHAITDERTGNMLPQPITLAHFTLQDVGGPVRDERPDPTGLFSDGRFPNYTGVISYEGQPVAYPNTQGNLAHQVTFAADGKRIYVAHGVAGLYILNAEAIVNNTDATLAAGTAGCNWESTNVYRDGVIGGEIDATRLPLVANDCLHMVVHDDPGMKTIAASGNVRRYLALHDRSRFDPFPSSLNSTGAHSAIPVPDRPSLDANNTDGQRPAYLIMTTERGNCPTSMMYLLNIEAEAFPMVIGTYGVPQNELGYCVQTPTRELNGEPRRNLAWQNHNPTVFKNLVFVSWYGHGMRVLDISNPYNMREVAHGVPAPQGVARSYPVFSDGLFYWVDNRTGLHVARYTGPRANEVPTDMVYQGNDVPHH